MKSIEVELAPYQKKDLDKSLKYAYASALKDSKFASLIKKLKIKESVLYKHTSALENTVKELTNCEGCKGIAFCKNPVCGYVNYPLYQNDMLTFAYLACKYKKEIHKNKSYATYYELPLDLKNACMKNVDVTDKKRAKVIKWLKEFYDSYLKDKHSKGLYLHGSFGSGKTYLVMAILNELSKKGVKVTAVYYPTLLRNLKESFNDNYKGKIDYLLNTDILLLDDIGAESVTSWSRDEILGTILQYRMDNNLTTFLTSNLTIEELEINLATSKGEVDKVKSRRIIERIKQLTSDMELISINRRK